MYNENNSKISPLISSQHFLPELLPADFRIVCATYFKNSSSHLSLILKKCHSGQGTEMTVDEAENKIISMAHVADRLISELPFCFNSNATLIGQRNRRGHATDAFMNNKTYQLFVNEFIRVMEKNSFNNCDCGSNNFDIKLHDAECTAKILINVFNYFFDKNIKNKIYDLSQYFFEPTPTTIGRWKLESIYFHGNINFWISDHLPNNQIVLAYHKSEIDGPAFLFNYRNKTSLIIPEEVLEFDDPEIVSLHRVENYVTVLNLHEKIEKSNI